MVQAIILARMAYTQFAAGFGDFDALNAIPVILWFAVPILSSIGMYRPFFLGHLSFTGTCLLTYVSGDCGPNFLCIQNQNIRKLLSHPECGCFGKFQSSSSCILNGLFSFA